METCHSDTTTTRNEKTEQHQQKGDQTLTPREMDIIKSLDSRSFGFLDLTTPTTNNDKDGNSDTSSQTTVTSSSSISFMSSGFLKKGINMLRIELLSEHTSKTIQAKVLCHIAHLHLLLQEYTEALSAYQHCSVLDPNTSGDTSFLYGVGLIYFALGKYNWALEAFQKVLFLNPDFARLNEVHVRIGLILKKEGNLQEALKHFMLAVNHSGPCCFTKLEMHFHIGHIYHIKGDFHKAKQSFEWILASKNVPNDIKALTLRQLGWLYHTVPSIATRGEHPHAKAIELLKLAVSANPESGQAWYFLGRCHADQGQYRDAFLAYRQSVLAVEGHADTWCAIGILYQQMGQARDSLQAYITAVFFSPSHVETWTDLGLLYESCDQLIDGFLCYKNGLNAMEKKNKQQNKKEGMGMEGVQHILLSRVRLVEHQIQQGGGVAFHSQQSSLPTLFEAWTSLVPQHLREKYTPIEIPLLQLTPVPQLNGLLSPGLGSGRVTPGLGPKATRHKKMRLSKDPIILKNMSEGWNNLSPAKQFSNPPDVPSDAGTYSSHQLMPTLSPDFHSTDIPPVTFNHNPSVVSPNNLFTPQNLLPGNSDVTMATMPNVPMSAPVTFDVGSYSPLQQQQALRGYPLISDNNRSSLPQDLSAIHPLQLESTQNVNVEDYLSTLVSSPDELRGMPMTPATCMSIVNPHLKPHPSDTPFLGKRGRTNHDNTNLSKLVASSPVMISSTVRHQHSDRMPRPLNGNQSDTSSGVSSSHKMSISESSTPSTPSSPDFIDYDAVMSPIPEPHPGLGSPCEYMLTDPIRPPTPPKLPGIDLDQQNVPIFEVLSYKQGMSDELHSFCTNTDIPICIIRGLTKAVQFDLNLFVTETLMKQCGNHDVEIREQNLQAANENWDSTGRKQVWKCESSRSLTTVKDYGQYQLSIIQDETLNKVSCSSRKMLKFGTNCDLSDKDKWSRQLAEIKKLPKFLQVECPEANLLNHVGHTILGMNSVQLYMKVPGCRTPGHQENNNFCSVNVNIGPGDCEWFAVPNRYWGVVNQLCDKNKICFLTGSWWPILEELRELKVPVYRFTQYEGDVIWINPGSVHWVQANSSCNNIAWNVGSLTAHQLRMAWERYQWNKVKKVRSIVPMVTLTWNLARKMNITNSHMRQQISSYLFSSYRQCEQLLDQLHNANVPVIWHGRVDGELTPTCTMCSEEVFNILFVSTNKKGDHLVHCHKCVQHVQSKNKKATFTVLQQYTLTELQKTLSRYLPLSPTNKPNSR